MGVAVGAGIGLGVAVGGDETAAITGVPSDSEARVFVF